VIKSTLSITICSCSILTAVENNDALQSTTSSTVSKNQNTEVTLPSSSPYAANGTRLYAIAEWLYFQANESGLAYAINNEDFDILDDCIMGSGSVGQPKFDWHSGFRLGLGYNLPHDEWDMQLLWTWYEDQADSNEHSPGESPTIFPLFVHPNIYNPQSIAACLDAGASLFMHLNILDLDIGKQFRLSKSLSLKPHTGIRTAWLNQNYNINYSNLFDKSGEVVLDEYSTNIKNDFWGIGILAALGSQWDIKWGLSLFGDGAISLLYGFFDNSYSESFITPTGAGNVVVTNDNSFRASRAIMDLQLGLRWTSSAIKEKVKIVLQAGWEQHLFFSQNQIIRFVDSQNWGTFVQNQGDVDFQGWSAGAHIHF
jgi:hypothetical protein